MFPLRGGSTRGKGLVAVLDPPNPLVAKTNIKVFLRLVPAPPPPPPLPWPLALGSGREVSLGTSAIGDGWVGWSEGVVFGFILGAFLVGRGGVFCFGGLGVFLPRTGESAKQADELDVREEEQEEEKSVGDSEERSEQDSLGSLFFFFFWARLEGALGFGLWFNLFWGVVFVLVWGLWFVVWWL